MGIGWYRTGFSNVYCARAACPCDRHQERRAPLDACIKLRAQFRRDGLKQSMIARPPRLNQRIALETVPVSGKKTAVVNIAAPFTPARRWYCSAVRRQPHMPVVDTAARAQTTTANASRHAPAIAMSLFSNISLLFHTKIVCALYAPAKRQTSVRRDFPRFGHAKAPPSGGALFSRDNVSQVGAHSASNTIA